MRSCRHCHEDQDSTKQPSLWTLCSLSRLRGGEMSFICDDSSLNLLPPHAKLPILANRKSKPFFFTSNVSVCLALTQCNSPNVNILAKRIQRSDDHLMFSFHRFNTRIWWDYPPLESSKYALMDPWPTVCFKGIPFSWQKVDTRNMSLVDRPGEFREYCAFVFIRVPPLARQFKALARARNYPSFRKITYLFSCSTDALMVFKRG